MYKCTSICMACHGGMAGPGGNDAGQGRLAALPGTWQHPLTASPAVAGSCLGAVPAIGPPPGACYFVIRRSPMSVDRATVATGASDLRHWQPCAVQATPIVHGFTVSAQFIVRNRTSQDDSERFLAGLEHGQLIANGNDLSVIPIRVMISLPPADVSNRLPVSFDIARHACLAWTMARPPQYGCSSSASLRYYERDVGAILPHSASGHCCCLTVSSPHPCQLLPVPSGGK